MRLNWRAIKNQGPNKNIYQKFRIKLKWYPRNEGKKKLMQASRVRMIPLWGGTSNFLRASMIVFWCRWNCLVKCSIIKQRRVCWQQNFNNYFSPFFSSLFVLSSPWFISINWKKIKRKKKKENHYGLVFCVWMHNKNAISFSLFCKVSTSFSKTKCYEVTKICKLAWLVMIFFFKKTNSTIWLCH